MNTPPIDMLEAAKAVLPHAYAPYSHFSVAASVRSEDGKIFSGCNVENAAFPLTLCAEANAIGTLFAAGQKKITEILVLVSDENICPPCGSCRQRIFECADTNVLVHLCTMNGKYESHTIATLLPFAFGPNNLEKTQ